MKLTLSDYQAIIFDLGGVILNIDYHSTVQEFEKLGIQDFNQQFSQLKQTSLFDDYETGRISSADFINQLKQLLPKNTSEQAIIYAWNAILKDLPPHRLQFLNSVKAQLPTFLLSNTNDLHIQEFNQYLTETFQIADLSPYFNQLYLSYEVGMRKPDPEIFEYLLTKEKLIPEKTLFIDDTIMHIETARNLGIQTYHLHKGEDIGELFWGI
jgi:epoxide hydrolase-like predicted phosphatase